MQHRWQSYVPRSTAKLNRKAVAKFRYQGTDEYGPYDCSHEEKSD